ncbi:purine-cytosine permease family protein [Gordonia sp. MP11Mi]|uniref:Cytosine permease n=1 Tax=Gordonia sp. MP11Mi TaxID=3022769 RepID=A0AA97GVJ8_9ACTN
MSATSADRVLPIEQAGLDRIRPDQRKGRPHSLFGIWSSTNLTPATFVTGALGVQLGLSLPMAIFASIIGILLGSTLIPTKSYVGFRLGIPQMLMSRATFGRIGAVLPSLIGLFSFIGWFTVLDVLGAMALNDGLGIPLIPGIIVLGLITLAVAMIGHDLVHKVEKWVAAAVAIVFVILVFVAFNDIQWDYAGDTALTGGEKWGLFGAIVGIAFTYSGPGYTPYASDYTRYLPLKTTFRQIFTPSFLGMALSCTFVFALGAAIATIDPTADATALVGQVSGGLKIPIALAFAAGTVGANVLNVYSGSLTTLVFGLRVSRWATAAGVAAFGTVLAIVFRENFAANYEKWLLAVQYTVPAMDAIFLADFFLVKKGRHGYSDVDFSLERANPAFHWRAWLAYLVGVAVCIPFMSSFIHTGSVAIALDGADLSYLVSMVVAALIYCGTSISIARSKGRLRSRNIRDDQPGLADIDPDHAL